METPKYKVVYSVNEYYEVLEFDPNEDEYVFAGFSGSLADCEAWIRLHEKGYM